MGPSSSHALGDVRLLILARAREDEQIDVIECATRTLEVQLIGFQRAHCAMLAPISNRNYATFFTFLSAVPPFKELRRQKEFF